MGRPVTGGSGHESGEHQMRDQEVLRANRELVAYFKGRRTEREARAALKIIKAFIRDREHADPKHRRPLPGLERAVTRGTAAQSEPSRKRVGSRKPRRRRTDDTPSAPAVLTDTAPNTPDE